MRATCDIHLCKVPISVTNQLSFKTKNAQEDYFKSKVRYSYEKCSYQPRTAVLKIPTYVDAIQDVNYGYFDNEYDGNEKRFYFFICQKNYTNKGTTEIVIQIDVWQTWYWQIRYGQCFIERCHVSNDKIGANTIPEDFELGDYLCEAKYWSECTCGEMVYFLATSEYDDTEQMGGIFGKTYSGFKLIYYDERHINDMSQYIGQLCQDGKGDSIAFIFAYPKNMLPKEFDNGDICGGFSGVLEKYIKFSYSNFENTFIFKDTEYRPYNNKLLTYPYNFLTITNPEGGNVIIKFELFDSLDDIQFQITSVLTKNPTFECTPMHYANTNYAISDSISMAPFGLCSWNNDNYANWYAQHKNSINAQSINATASYNSSKAVNTNNYNNALDNNNTSMYKGLINTAGGVIGNLSHGNFGGALISGVQGGANTYLDYQQGKRNANNDLSNSNLLNTTNYQNTIRGLMASVKDAQVQPNTCKGDTSSCGLDMARDTACFYFKQTMIKPEYAKMIDMYFQMYGYAVNLIDYPVLKSRKKWNYIKTINSNIYGEIPFDDIQMLNAIFDNGFTLWHDEDYMFNYAQDNPIV